MIYEFNKILDQAEVDKNAEDKEVIREEDKKKKKAITEVYKKSALSDDSFGLPDARKYPLHDKKHVISAIKMFNYVDEKDEKELAENIIKKVKEYNMTDLEKYIVIGEKNRFRSYWGVDKHINETSIKEDAYEKLVLKPIYIVTVYTGTAFGKVITAVTGDTYSHAAIGFDSSLDDLYSFNAASDLGRRGGLSKESLTGYRNENPDGDLQVATVFVKERDYNILQERLDWLKEHASETFYDFSNILNIIFKKTKGSVNQLSMICSEFVEYLFNLINVDLTGKSANLTTPGDLSRIKNPKVYKIFEGKIKHYNVKRMDKRVNQVMSKAEPIREQLYIFLEKGSTGGKEIDDNPTDLIMTSSNKDFIDMCMGASSSPLYMHGKDAIDSKMKQHLEDYDAKKEQQILDAEDIVKEYNIYINASFENVLKTPNKTTIDESISGIYNVLIAPETGLDKESVKKYIINSFYDISEDPKHIRDLLKLRLNYNRRMIDIYKNMLRLNYQILGLTESEANYRIQMLDNNPSITIKELKELFKKNESKFKKGDCIDLSSLGFGKLFVTKGELGDIKDFADIDNVLQLLMRYDCVLITHGDNAKDDYNTLKYGSKAMTSVDLLNAQHEKVNNLNRGFDIAFKAFERNIERDLKPTSIPEYDRDNITRFIKSMTGVSKNHSVMKNEIERNWERRKRILDKESVEEANHIITLYIDDMIDFSKRRLEIYTEENKLYAIKKSHNKVNSKFEKNSEKAKSNDSIDYTWVCQPIKSDSSSYYVKMNDFLKELKKEGYKKIYVICCNPGHHKLNPELEKDHTIHIKYSPNTLIAESDISAYEYVYDDSLEVDQTLKSMEESLISLSESYGIDYYNDAILEQSYNDVFEDYDTLNEGALSTLWQGVVALAKKVVEALIALFKKIVEFIKGILIRIKNFFTGKKTVSYELNGKTKYIALESASVKDMEFKTYSDMETKIMKTCNKIATEIKTLSDKQPKITEDIKNNAEKLVQQKTNESSILEAKEFPVQFNDDGDLIVKNYKKLNYKEEYYKSVKLLSAYKAVDNMEGIKYELAKTWFLMEVLSKKINSTHTSDQERKEFLEIKKRANNTFTQYLKILGLRESEFNFGEYYKNSPFSDTEIRIAGSTLTHGIKLLKQII